jgi:hypothetical protein
MSSKRALVVRHKKDVRMEPAASMVAQTFNQMEEGKAAAIRLFQPSKQRMLRLLELCRAYSAEASAVRKAAPPNQMTCQLDIGQGSLYRQIQIILRRYHYDLVVNHFVSRPERSVSAFPTFSYQWRPERRAFLIEAATAPRILEAMQQGQIEGLKRCDYCKKWFYSRRRIQRFCPYGYCRENAWQESPAGRESNRKRQAAFYATPAGRQACLDRQAKYYRAGRVNKPEGPRRRRS